MKTPTRSSIVMNIKEPSYQIGTQRSYCKTKQSKCDLGTQRKTTVIVKQSNKNVIYSFCLVFKDHPRSPNWTLDFEPAFSQRVYFPLSPRSLFPTGQRFPFPNHVTSGCMSPRSFFPTGQRFPILKHVTSGSHEPTILFSYLSAVSHSKTRDLRFP